MRILGWWMLLACCCLAAPHYDAAASRAGVAGVQGTVETRQQGGWKKAQVGDLLVPGQAVRTGPKSIAVVVLDDLTSLRLGASSELSIISIEDEAGQAQLTSGRVWVNANPGGAKTTFELQGPNAVAAVKGTSFEMDVNGGRTRVRIWEGKVQCQAPGSPSVAADLLEAGKEYAAGSSGKAQVLAVDLDVRDQWQAWNQDCDREVRAVASAGWTGVDDGPSAGGEGSKPPTPTTARPVPAIVRGHVARPRLKLNRQVLQKLGARLPAMPRQP